MVASQWGAEFSRLTTGSVSCGYLLREEGRPILDKLVHPVRKRVWLLRTSFAGFMKPPG